MSSICRIALLAGLSIALAGCGAYSEALAERQPDAGSVHVPQRTQPAAAAAPLDVGADTADNADIADAADAGRLLTVDTSQAVDANLPKPDAQPASENGSASLACPVGATREIALDDPTPLGTARALRDTFTQAVAALDADPTPFRWSPRFGGTTTIIIDTIEWGATATYTASDPPGCEDLRIPASLRLTTQDGTLDEVAKGWVRGTHFTGSIDRSGKLGEWLVEQAQHPALMLQSIGVMLSVEASQAFVGEVSVTTDIDDYDLVSALYGLGKFDSTWARGIELDAPYERTAPIEAMCAAAEPADVSASFSPGITDLSSKLSKVWFRCSGTSTGFPHHDGIAITATGWKHIAYRDGAWIEQTGFGHEGAIEVIDTAINGPGSQQVAFWDMLPFTFASPSVDLSSSATSLRLALGGRGSPGFEGMYIASGLTVGAAQLVYSDGERAGAEACDKGEAHLRRIGNAAQLSAALTGAWIFCSGSFRPDAAGIEFTAFGTYNHIAADGGVVASGLYQVIETPGFNGPRSSQINLSDFDGTSHIMVVPLQSDAPLKLSFGLNEGRGVLSAR